MDLEDGRYNIALRMLFVLVLVLGLQLCSVVQVARFCTGCSLLHTERKLHCFCTLIVNLIYEGTLIKLLLFGTSMDDKP